MRARRAYCAVPCYLAMLTSAVRFANMDTLDAIPGASASAMAETRRAACTDGGGGTDATVHTTQQLLDLCPLEAAAALVQPDLVMTVGGAENQPHLEITYDSCTYCVCMVHVSQAREAFMNPLRACVRV